MHSTWTPCFSHQHARVFFGVNCISGRLLRRIPPCLFTFGVSEMYHAALSRVFLRPLHVNTETDPDSAALLAALSIVHFALPLHARRAGDPRLLSPARAAHAPPPPVGLPGPCKASRATEYGAPFETETVQLSMSFFFFELFLKFIGGRKQGKARQGAYTHTGEGDVWGGRATAQQVHSQYTIDQSEYNPGLIEAHDTIRTAL